MPMIEAKVTMELPAEKRDVLKAEFGKAISIMGKAVYVSYWGTANWGWNGSNF